MEYNNSREREVLLDIESGGNGFPGDVMSVPVAGNKQGKRLLNKLTSGVLRYNILACGGSISNLDDNLGKPSLDLQDNAKILIDKSPGRQREERMPFLEKAHAKEKTQSTNSKKPSKPPRPPKGPSLGASDLKLVKEISELVMMKKHARKERIKALKRARAAKFSSSPSSSNNSTLCGMAVTVVFFLIIIFQGFSWRNCSTSILQGSPEPATGTNGLISVQVFNNLLPGYGMAPSSETPSSVEQLFGSGFTSPG